MKSLRVIFRTGSKINFFKQTVGVCAMLPPGSSAKIFLLTISLCISWQQLSVFWCFNWQMGRLFLNPLLVMIFYSAWFIALSPTHKTTERFCIDLLSQPRSIHWLTLGFSIFNIFILNINIYSTQIIHLALYESLVVIKQSLYGSDLISAVPFYGVKDNGKQYLPSNVFNVFSWVS